MKPARHVLLSLVTALALAAAGPILHSQEGPLAAGSDGVPVPKRVKHVQPVYPPDAIAQGVRGIVILDLVIDAKGQVEAVNVVRSVPGLDEAAIAAARQWEYEPVKMDGKPVSVRLTVPITFALALPRLVRDDGIPELRQGATPPWPQGAPSRGGSATAEVTLESDGRIAVANVVNGDEPWSSALVNALRTWRFSPPPEEEEISFRVEAQWTPQRGNEQPRVALRASGLRRSDLLTAARQDPPTPPEPPREPAETEPRDDAPVQAPPAGAPPAPGSVPDALPPQPTTPAPGPPAAPGPGPVTGTPPAAMPSPPTLPVPGSGESAPPAPPTPEPGARPASAGASAPPPVEVITAPPPPGPVENGISAVRDVTLAPGVPDLARGRRPVPPPLARMNGTTGSVEVVFSVSAAGATTVQSARGPELLRRAAEQSVASWVFRRARADRAYLTAAFTYEEDKANATVKPAAPPASAATGEGVPATMAPAPAQAPVQPEAPAVAEPAARTPAPGTPGPEPVPAPRQPQPQQPGPPATPPTADPATPPAPPPGSDR